MKSGNLPPRDSGSMFGVEMKGQLIQIDINGNTYELTKEQALRLLGEIAATLECSEAMNG
jgi:hypothetical protein